MRKILNPFHIIWYACVIFQLGLTLLIGTISCDTATDPIPDYVQITILEGQRQLSGSYQTTFHFTEFEGPQFTTTRFPIYKIGNTYMIKTSSKPHVEEVGGSHRYGIRSRYRMVRRWWNSSSDNRKSKTPLKKTKPGEIIAPVDSVKSPLLYW